MILRLGKAFLGKSAMPAAALATLMVAAPVGTLQADQPPLSPALQDLWVTLLPPVEAPQRSFTLVRDGVEQSIALEDLSGDVLLVNFWATWCAPCIHEMPSLDQLQADLAEEGLQVVAISVDRGGLSQIEPFFVDLRLDDLAVYLDPKGELARDLDVRGLPSSYLIDRNGQVVGAMQGAYDWAADDAKALIRHYLDQPVRQQEARR
ncbi:TlpA disulfide reductase family protein [Algihabitans sp.]|uniref:TlpA disulfide reductase family protein n=1 Tax=Algihabitans sp. TaxID=2821514 RepID=UPI003BAAC7DC